MEVYKNLIGGEFLSPSTKEYFDNLNPADSSDVIGQFPRSGLKDIEWAVASAKKAFPLWSNMAPPKRADILFNIARRMYENRQKFAEIILRENGKSIQGGLGEVQSSVDAAEFAAGEGRRMYGQTTFSSLDKRWVLIKRVPVGICGLITAWNAPLAIISWKLFPALICGNTVVLKPSEDTPLTANLLAEIFNDSGLPKGVVNIVHGIGEEAGKVLIDNSEVDLFSFTGSSEVGQIISDTYGKRLKKCSLELGGKNGLLVMDDADLEVAKNAIISGAFSCSGQRCAATSRAIIHESVYDTLLEMIVNDTKKIKVGPGTDPANIVNPIINKRQLANIKAAVDKAIKDGARLVTGGNILTNGEFARGNYIEPTIFINVDERSDLAQNEIFGPVLAIFKCRDYNDGIRLMNSTNYGLTASIHTTNFNLAIDAMDRIEAGVCYVNGPTFGSEAHIPFGGIKKSGNGHREPGTQALDVFSEYKTVYLDYSQVSQHSQIASETRK